MLRAVPEILPMKAEELLNRFWLAMRDDNSATARAEVAGALTALQATGLLNAAEVEGWATRLGSCPGHEDEGSRSWCAYCGNL